MLLGHVQHKNTLSSISKREGVCVCVCVVAVVVVESRCR